MRRALVCVLLVMLVAMPAVVFASRGADDLQTHSAQLQHAKRSGTAWRNFSTALVVDVPVVVPRIERAIVPSDQLASFVPLASPIFVPPRG